MEMKIEREKLIEIIRFALDEILAIDGEIRLDPSVIKAYRRKQIKLNILRKTLDNFNISYSADEIGFDETENEYLDNLVKKIKTE